jgi:transcriptional regulator
MERAMLSCAAMAGAHLHSQFVSWQLADAVRDITLRVTQRPPFSGDRTHRARAESAIDAVCRNIAEGLGCASHAEFACYLESARRSLNEYRDCLRAAQLKGYVSEAEAGELRALSRRLYPTLNNFIAYLHGTLLNGRDEDDNVARHNQPVAFRRHLLELLTEEPRSVSSLARDLGMRRKDVEEDLRHALRSARAAGRQIEVIPARCKTCDFVFSSDKLMKPGRCPACKGTRLLEPMMRVVSISS